jgi:sulfatase modifying factor 1
MEVSSRALSGALALLGAVALVRCGASYGSDSTSSPVEAGSDDADSAADAAPDVIVRDAQSSPGCPSGRGPSMVRIDIAGGESFCIDSTEVTESDYRAYLDTAPNPSLQPSICSFNTTFVPSTVTFSNPDHPIVKVDWCDALAFCAWAGKRLCGNVKDGGPLGTQDSIDPQRDEWMIACTRLGTREYAYGPTYVPGKCNDNSVDASASAAVASFSDCEGGYAGIFDMNGNVTEWENACDDVDGGRVCTNRGSSWVADGHCSYASGDDYTGASSDWGFRCCASITH